MWEVRFTKRRAIAARLLAFLLPLTVCWLAVAHAEAALLTPKLNGTNPSSSHEVPAFSLTPSVVGEAEPDEVIKTSLPLTTNGGLAGSVAAHPTKNPNFEIVIFRGEDCSGAVLGSGTAATLESTGITVTVGENEKTIISAKQFDPTDPGVLSECSNALSYWEGSVPPEEGSGPGAGGAGEGGESGDGPSGGSGGSSAGGSSSGGIGPANPLGSTKPDAPHIHTNPGGVANDTSPFVVGSTVAAESVSIYADEGCRGAPVATGSADQLQGGFEISVAPNATTTFSAAAIIGQHTACSDPVTYTEDSTAPRTRITMAPGVKTRKRKAVFRFKDITEDPPGTTFSCKVDKKKWKPCASPFRVKHLKLGRHTVKIRATDLAGNHERKPVKRRFIVVHAGGG